MGCIQYKYYDRLLHVKQDEDGIKRAITYNINDGVLVIDPEDRDGPGLPAIFGGARKHLGEGDDRVEILCQYFMYAKDGSTLEWAETALGKANLERFPEAPANLVYRVGGAQPKDWISEWSAVASLIDKCTVQQVPTHAILRLCTEAAKKSKTTLYYDSAWNPFEETEGQPNPPVQLSGSAAPHAKEKRAGKENAAGSGASARGHASASGMGGAVIDLGSDDDEQPLSKRQAGKGKRPRSESIDVDAGGKGRYRIKKRAPGYAGDSALARAALGLDADVDEMNEEVCEGVPSSRERPSGRSPRIERKPGISSKPICNECGEEGDQLMRCQGACSRSFHMTCAGIRSANDQDMLLGSINAKNLKWECSQCRMGKSTCMICNVEGFVNSEADGLIRCRKDGCGRAYHRSCIDNAGEAGLELLDFEGGFECPVHACFMCSETERPEQHLMGGARRRLVVCWCCPKAFCDRSSCTPWKSKRLGGHFIVCDPALPNHSRAYEPGAAARAARVEVTLASVLDDARAGATFEELCQPERKDEFAGAFYEAGLGIGCDATKLFDEQRRNAMGKPWPPPSDVLQQIPSEAALAHMEPADKKSARDAGELIKSGAIPWGAKSVPSQLRSASTASSLGSMTLKSSNGVGNAAAMRAVAEDIAIGGVSPIPGAGAADDSSDVSTYDASRFKVRVIPDTAEESYMGRFYPMPLTRWSAKNYVEDDTSNEVTAPLLLEHVGRPRVTAKLKQLVLARATGAGSEVRRLIMRGLVLEPRMIDYGGENVWRNSFADGPILCSGREVLNVQRGVWGLPGALPPDEARIGRLKNQSRSMLNGMSINRAKYTSFSRHYTSARVLKAIADVVQTHVNPGDTYVDFACGQNSFGGLLKDPATGSPLRSVAFDILSPADKSDGFHRRPWASVDATTLPAGELIIGLNPPFGHLNKEAIEFVKHAVCARPRLIVLIMPATNYNPEGYELILNDDQLCRGSVFYAPGSNSSNWINASRQSPSFLLYKRNDFASTVRVPRCCHVMTALEKVRIFKRKRDQHMQRVRIGDRRVEDELEKTRHQEEERVCGGALAKKAKAKPCEGPGAPGKLRQMLGDFFA